MKIVDLRPGLQVLHPQYGLGDVKLLTEKTAEVLFNEGRKTLTEELVAELKPAEPRARLEGLGCRLINTARSGPISVAWHDGGPLFPHPVELHEHNDVIAGMHDRLVALRAAADR